MIRFSFQRIEIGKNLEDSFQAPVVKVNEVYEPM